MMKTVLLENELFNRAMTDLMELRDVMELEFIDKGHIWTSAEYVRRTTAQILRALEKAAVAGQNTTEDGTQFEIVNDDPEMYMDVKLITELES